MEITVRDDKRMVEVWLTTAEKNDVDLRSRLKDLYAQYAQDKYFVAVFESGDGDLYCNTLKLLKQNKTQSA